MSVFVENFRYLTAGILVVLFGLGNVDSVSAQVEFTDSAQPVRYEQYQAVFECRSAISRILDSLRKADPVWRDTLPKADREATTSVPPLAVSLARRCGRTLQFDRRYLREWFEILLYRNDTSTLLPLVRREVIYRSYSSVREAFESLYALMIAYKEIPSQDMLPMEMIDTFLHRNTFDIPGQVVVWGSYVNAAQARDDHSLAELAAARVVAMLPGLDTFNADGGAFRQAILNSIAARYRRELLDSLAHGGTESYSKFWRYIHEPALKAGWMTEYGPSDNLQGIGSTASPVNAVYWFPSLLEQTVPTRGKLSLLVFMDVSSYFSVGRADEDADLIATLRRMHEKYPDLEVTIVWRALGWFGLGPALTPKEEGEIVRKWLLDVRQLPIRVAIDSTPYYYLPEPDSRRINAASENDVNYRLGVAGTLKNDALHRKNKGVLIDREGRIIKTFPLNRNTESMVSEFIDILNKRSARANGQ